ncbi:MAG: hypothetical protein HZC02_04950 [Candidatus Levybacteria bacterium]|nr:hypothetical protein [Candidatus Levybacteria bacterium]
MKKVVLSTLASFSTLILRSLPALAASKPVELCPPGAVCTGTTTDPGVIIGNILNFLFILAAILSVAFLIWGGIKWITANGDKTKVQSARDTIIGAIIGLVVAFAAYFIINIVLTLLFGHGLGEMTVPTIFQ